MICGTRGSGRLSISVVILRETFVHLVLVLILVLTDHRLKTWVIIQWYFSKKDIVKHESGKSGSLKMYVSTAPQALPPVILHDQGYIILRKVRAQPLPKSPSNLRSINQW